MLLMASFKAVTNCVMTENFSRNFEFTYFIFYSEWSALKWVKLLISSEIFWAGGWRVKEIRGVKALRGNLGLPPQTEILPIPYKVFFEYAYEAGNFSKIWVVEKGWMFCYLRLLATCIVMFTSSLRERDRGIWHRDCALETKLCRLVVFNVCCLIQGEFVGEVMGRAHHFAF